MLVEPVGEPLEPLGLDAVHLGVAVGVVAHEHLREVGIELLDVGAEVLAVLEVELVLARTSRPASPAADRAPWPRSGMRFGVPNCSSTRHPVGLRVHALLGRLQQPLEDQVLRVRDRLRLLGRGVALDAEHLLLEGAAVIEREDVELAVVAECHVGTSPCRVPWVIPCARGAPLLGPLVHPRDRGGAHDRRSRRRSTSRIPSSGCSPTSTDVPTRARSSPS